MPDQQDLINRQMEATRSSLCDKLETLEQKVVNTVTGAKDAVTETIGNVKDSVQETVDAVKGTARDTVDSVREAFNLSHHVERHPCLSMGGAVVAGFLLERLIERETAPRPHHWADAYRGRHSFAAAAGNGQSFAAERPTPVDAETTRGATEYVSEAASQVGGWLSDLAHQFAPEINKLKAMAIGTGLGLVRDVLMPSVPQQLRPGLTDLVDRVTSKVGGETYRPGAFGQPSGPTGTAGVV